MKDKRRLVMVGASGHGKVCAEIAEMSDKYSEIFFLDDNLDVKKCGEKDVIGISNDFCKYINNQTDFFVSIGNHEHRKRIQEEIEIAGGNIATLFHPRAVISKNTTFGSGTVVMPGAVINTGAAIGKGVIVNTLSSVDHDCIVDDWSHIAVGVHLCGTVKVGRCCWIGAGATVINNLNICDDVVVGAGATVIRDICNKGTYIGIPAKNTNRN